MRHQIQTLDSRGIILKTFMSEFEVHQPMISRLAICAEVIEVAGELLINPLKAGWKATSISCATATDCQNIASKFVVCYEKTPGNGTCCQHYYLD